MTTLKAKLIAVTQPTIEAPVHLPEQLVYYAAKVSNPSGQDNMENIEKFFDYCMKNKHWSVFEMANAIIEVEAPRDITRQILRHRSFSFQEFSQRYSNDIEMTDREYRRQDTKNRQNSFDDLSEDLLDRLQSYTESLSDTILEDYKRMLREDVAKECARVILPEGLTMSRMYVNGTLRSWMHYLEVRDTEGVTQHEHVELARLIKEELKKAFPITFKDSNEGS